MRKGRSTISIIRSAAGPALALLVIGNFAGYAVMGSNGLLALGDYRHQLQVRQAQLRQVEAQRAELAHTVALLDQRHVDPDKADELVREKMGYTRPDEVILQTP